ncbi:hypothetical protein V1522DRAFT_424066 [Lipomyces starkeyi]
MSFFSLALMVLFTEETYAPNILTKKAADLRRRTGNWGIQSRQEQVELNLHELLAKNFARPLVMLVREPILTLPYTLRKIAANGGNPVPEERLIPTMMGSVLFPIGLFWLGWTGNYPHAIPWIVPTLAGSFVGGGIIF